ncbi:MAG: hypothetical protein A2W99_03315 [Bacteroidetes bacterium GWF2_33_16]|nr:MAG: hypothetical protein A2X00_11755 [Bacteroidetes bacterium GWE2_32_14]OFY08217.1 MAG: hypothetical protein A2W99_03315 [Bacteroidetes bacterium GWF2_33_16]
MIDYNRTLQLFYAGVLADSVKYYDKAGILGIVTEEKRKQQEVAAAAQLKQLDIKSVSELFEEFSKIFGCINWEVKTAKTKTTAHGKSCLLCSISKRMGTAQPCFLYCINPFKALINHINSEYTLKINQTLWESDQCIFEVLNTLEK